MDERLGICHSDVKLGNIHVMDKLGDLVNDTECKLADVGNAEEVCSSFNYPAERVEPIRPSPHSKQKYSQSMRGSGGMNVNKIKGT